MPNPFMRTGVPNRSHQPPDRPEPIAPVIEEIAEPNFAYRGIEDHGVPVHGNTFMDVPGYGATVDAEFEIEPEPPHVVPVRIVRDEADGGGQEIRVMRVRQTVIGTEPQRVTGRNIRRQGLYLKPVGGGTAVVIGPTRNEAQNAMLAYPLTDAVENTILSQDEVWICAPGAAANQVVPVYVREEFSMKI